MGTEVVLRIVSKAGRIRLVCDPDTFTLAELRELVAKKFNADPSSITLATDSAGSQIMLGNERPLAFWGLRKDGTELFAFADAEVAITPSTTLNPTVTSPAPGHSAPINKEGHKYKCFEDYLEEIDFNINQLPLSQSYRPVRRNTLGPTKLPPSITLKHQVYRHVDHAEVMNVAALTSFVNRWRATDMLQQRAAFLIGYYIRDPHFGPKGMRAVVEAIYEPASTSVTGHYNPQDFLNLKPLDEMALRVARGLGLELIGWAFTHLGRSQLITTPDLITMGKLQLQHIHKDLHYTGYPISTFVTLTISPKESLNGEPGSDAFAVSDLGLAMLRDGVLEEVDVPNGDMNTERDEDRFVRIRKPVDKNEFMPTVLESTKEVEKLDTDWLLVRLAESAPKEVRLLMKRNAFPHANVTMATFEDVQTFLANPGNTPPHEHLADFHFVLFIANTLGYESAEQIINAILNKSDIAEDFYTLLNSLD